MNPFEYFVQLVDGPQPLALLPAAAALAQYADCRFDPARVEQAVPIWGDRLAARLAPDRSAPNRLRLLNQLLFDELGLRGDNDGYYAADNSYLHRVIERRRGIPITLSILYIEVGRAVGLRLSGVAFPAHFLVKLAVADGALFIAVFAGGTIPSSAALRQRLALARQAGAELPLETCLRSASARDILVRMLVNLKSIHAEAGQWQALLDLQHRLVALLPEAPEQRRDRALAWERLECPRAAACDLIAYFRSIRRRPMRPKPGSTWHAWRGWRVISTESTMVAHS